MDRLAPGLLNLTTLHRQTEGWMLDNLLERTNAYWTEIAVCIFNPHSKEKVDESEKINKHRIRNFEYI
jgi:hypothetical protein